MDETVKAEILDHLAALVADVAPALQARAMYGGIMLEREAGVAATAVGGYFAYQAHVSFEFSHGARLIDPAGLLEGKGKARRHVKLRALGDVAAKDVAGFLTQAVAAS